MPERAFAKRSSAWLLAYVLGVGVLSCQTTKIINFPPPDGECPTAEDLELVDDLLLPPDSGADTVLALERGAVVDRFINATAYCMEGDERLR